MTSAENNVNQSFALTRDADVPDGARGTLYSLVAPQKNHSAQAVPCPLRPGFMPGRKGTRLQWQTPGPYSLFEETKGPA
jgi:hypothetical protein